MNASARSWPLIVSGALLLLAALLTANPWFATRSEDWPWAALGDPDVSLRAAALTGLWLLAGLWSLLLGIAGPRRPRAAGVAVLALLLLTQCTDTGWSVDGHRLPMLLALVLLGAGLWQARGPAGGGLARPLAAIGGLLVIWTAVASFEGAAGPHVHSSILGEYLARLRALPTDWTGSFAPPTYLWREILPGTVTLVAAGFGLLVGCGARLPRTAAVLFFVLVAALTLPAFVRASPPDLPLLHPEVSALVRILSGLLRSGVFPFLLGTFALVDLVGTRRAADIPDVGGEAAA